jgi:hypothetical protein
MRWGILVVLMCGAQIATAAPDAEPSPSWEIRPRFAMHVGLHVSAVAASDDAPGGGGPWADAAVGLEIKPRLTLSAFLSYETFRDEHGLFDGEDFIMTMRLGVGLRF